MTGNFSSALAFVWQAGLDDPNDKFHISPHDPGMGTNSGVTQATWDNAVTAGLVVGTLDKATIAQLGHVLQTKFWGTLCDELPHGIDLLYFNGIVMSEHFPRLVQQCCGFMGADVDGAIGPVTKTVIRSRDPETFIDAVSGAHYQYLTTLAGWATFGNGWTKRLKLARAAARAMADAAPIA
jgi:lysozyme family protein